jgi:inorganic pyrophosphatase
MAKKLKSMIDPMGLRPIEQNSETLQVIVETPRGCRNKFAFDPEQKIFALKKVLPAGMSFPYDFGFLPQTKAADGDAIDVLLLMDEPAFTGCLVKARLLGVIEGEQIEGKQKTRNDRLVAVAEMSHEYAHLKQLSDLPKQLLRELQEFFVNYHHLEGKEYRLLGCKGKAAAMNLIKQAKN